MACCYFSADFLVGLAFFFFYLASYFQHVTRAILLLTEDAEIIGYYQEVHKRKTPEMIIIAPRIHNCAFYDSHNTLVCMTESS